MPLLEGSLPRNEALNLELRFIDGKPCMPPPHTHTEEIAAKSGLREWEVWEILGFEPETHIPPTCSWVDLLSLSHPFSFLVTSGHLFQAERHQASLLQHRLNFLSTPQTTHRVVYLYK